MKLTTYPDLAVRSLGGAVLAANDESFAEKECLIRASEPVFSPATFGSKGQVYDGWETRRRREPGHDWAVIRLGVSGVIHRVVVDTAFFKGNYPPEISLEATTVDGHPEMRDLEDASWETVVPRSPVNGDTAHDFDVDNPRRYTHVRLNMHPDGGVARLRVHGAPVPDPRFFSLLPLDLAALANGAATVAASDAFFSRPDGVIMPGLAASQADGWETGRRRDDGHDWLIVKLAGRGTIRLAEMDTMHLKYNAPGWAGLSSCDVTDERRLDDPGVWQPLLERTALRPDSPHRFAIPEERPATHVRLDVYPDGGLSRLRLFGELTPEALRDLTQRCRRLSEPAAG